MLFFIKIEVLLRLHVEIKKFALLITVFHHNLFQEFFSRQIKGTLEETEIFSQFIDSVIGLKRDNYDSLITSLRSYVDAIEIIGTNIDLAYSLLVYSMEALAQRSDLFIPKWKDYPQNTRDNLDRIFDKLDKETATEIKTTLLKDSNLKSTKRFLDFIHSNIDNDFFINEAPPGLMTVRKSEFDRALRNAYAIRSKFAHLLQPIQKQLKHPHMANGDVVRFADEPYLTISGLVRVAQHVIKSFVRKGEKATSEKYDWRNELPSIVRVEFAPQYWIWHHKGLKAEHATKKLSGFLSQLEAVMLRSESITDLRELLEEYEKLIGQAATPFKLQMLTTYVLYNGFVNDEYKNKNFSIVFDKHKALFDECTIETMLAWLLMGQEWPWDVIDCVTCWNKYQSMIYTKNCIKISSAMNVAILIELALKFFKDNNVSEYQRWMGEAILDAAGQKGLQKKLIQALEKMVAMRGMDVFNEPSNMTQ